MFGEKLDYFVLRALADRRNLATEEMLNVQAARPPVGSPDRGTARLRGYMDRLDGHLPISPDLRYLDMGCGTGELSIALAKLGCDNVTGVDFVPRYIDRCRANAVRAGVGDSVQFICQDLATWTPTRKYDVLLSVAAFEHIRDPRLFLRKMADFISPGGIAVLVFGPLFHSPFGDHMNGFFRLGIPWRGVLFSEKAVLRLRREYFRPTDRAEHYRDIVGGLNQMRYSQFLDYVAATGWRFRFLSVNSFLRRRHLLHHVSDLLVRILVLRDYLVCDVSAILSRSAKA